MKLRSFKIIFIGMIVLLLQSACTPWVILNQISSDQWMTIDSGSSIGQSFVADNAGLQAVQLFLTPQSGGDGNLTFHLRSEPTSKHDLAISRIPIQEINENRYYRFDFPHLTGSSAQYYYIFLEIDGTGSIQVGNGPAESYLNGAAYIDHQPIEAQLSFKLDYDRSVAMREIIRQIIPWMAGFLVLIILFAIPGWALLSLVWSEWSKQTWFLKLAISMGVSYALYILLVLYTSLFHLQLGIWYALLPAITGGIIITWRNKQKLPGTIEKRKIMLTIKQVVFRAGSLPDLVLVIILVILFLLRAWQMRGLDAPMWGDSVQHTAIVQLMIDHQGLFTNWQPYASYETFSMHFGFPLAAALYTWVTGTSSEQAVVFVGQFLSVLAAIALYPMAVRLANGNRWAGIFAVLAAGLLSPMPAFYINWGRYAQLAGQVIFPILLWMIWDVLKSTEATPGTAWHARFQWMKIILVGMALTGMVLCQFRMPYYLMAFLLAWILGWIITHWKLDPNAWLSGIISLVMIGIIGAALFIPWGLRLQNGNLLDVASMRAGQVQLIEIIRQDYLEWKNILFYVPLGMIIIACVGWVWALTKKAWLVVSIGLWIALMASIYSLMIINIPGAQFVDSFAVLIAIYIPVSFLVGYILGDFVNTITRWKYGKVIAVSAVIIIGLAGAWNQRNIARPNAYSMVTRPDLKAMAWIRAETPMSSRFLVEGFRAFWNTSVAGSDSGWWIPILAQRENTMPPQYALTDEMPIEKDYSQRLIDLVAQLEQTSLNSEIAIKLLCDYGITHVFIGQRQGMVGNYGDPLFTPAELETSQFYRLDYHQDRVYIFALNEADCGQ